MKNILLFVIAFIIGCNALIVAIYFDAPDRVCAAVLFGVAGGVFALIGGFKDDEEKPRKRSPRKRKTI